MCTAFAVEITGYKCICKPIGGVQIGVQIQVQESCLLWVILVLELKPLISIMLRLEVHLFKQTFVPF